MKKKLEKRREGRSQVIFPEIQPPAVGGVFLGTTAQRKIAQNA